MSMTNNVGASSISPGGVKNNKNNSSNHDVDAGIIDASWRKQYEALLEFRSVAGHFDVPNDGTILRRWVDRQHYDYTGFCDILEGRAKGNTTTCFHEEKLKLLRKVGFIFKRIYEKKLAEKQLKFDNNCELLKEFRAKYGHVHVSANRKMLKVLMGRENEEAAEPSKDEDEKVEDENEGKDVEGEDKDKAEVTKTTRKKHDDDEEFTKYYRLGQWLASIRSRIKQSKANPNSFQDDVLTPENLRRLDDIGVCLEPRSPGRKRKSAEDRAVAAVKRPATINKKAELNWEARFEEMKKFCQEHGHCLVPNKLAALRNWLDTQRKEYKKLQAGEPSQLTALRVSRLAEIGFQFQASKIRKTFEARFQEWAEYREKNGKDPRRYSEDGLGKWMCMIRRKKRAFDEGKTTNLTKDQIDLLNGKGFFWGVAKAPEHCKPVKRWSERYQDLLKFKAEHGHTNVPQKMEGLGNWVHKQRQIYSEMHRGKMRCNHKLTPEKIAKLNAINFQWQTRFRTTQKSESPSGAGVAKSEENPDSEGDDSDGDMDDDDDDEENDDDDGDDDDDDDDEIEQVERNHPVYARVNVNRGMFEPTINAGYNRLPVMGVAAAAAAASTLPNYYNTHSIPQNLLGHLSHLG